MCLARLSNERIRGLPAGTPDRISDVFSTSTREVFGEELRIG